MHAPSSLLKPPAVPIGSAGSASIAPASFAQPERVQRGLDALRALGYDAALWEAMHSSADRSTLRERRSSGSPICMRRLPTIAAR